VPEVGSEWLRDRLGPEEEPAVLSSVLLRIEMQSAFARRLRDRTVTSDEYASMSHLFDVHRSAVYRLSPVSKPPRSKLRGIVSGQDLIGGCRPQTPAGHSSPQQAGGRNGRLSEMD
jgi:hypothetical protein